MDNIIERHLSLFDAIGILEKPVNKRASSIEESARRTKFTLTDSLHEAISLAKNGDKDLFIKLTREAEKISANSENLLDCVIATDYDVSGHTVDIGRYLEGLPECMLETTVTSSSRIINLVINIGASWKIEATDLLRRLNIIGAIIKALEISGYSVSIACQFAARSFVHKKSDNKYISQVTLKDPDKYADWGVVAFWLVHPSALRRIFFKLSEHESERIRNYFGFHNESCYGIGINHKPDIDCVYIPLMDLSDTYKTDAELKTQIAEYFRAQNVFVNWQYI